MKTFIVALCLIGAQQVVSDYKGKIHGKSGEKGKTIEKVKGCENANIVKDIKASDCCPALSKFFGKDACKTCETTCKDSKSSCCEVDCVMKTLNIIDANGVFSPTLAVAALNTAVRNDASWPMQSIVDACVQSARNDLKKWIDHENNSTKTEKKFDATTCTNPTNAVIAKCIRRELILACPNWTQNDNCAKLLTFAKSCPAYPFAGGCKHSGEKKEDKHAHKHGSISETEPSD